MQVSEAEPIRPVEPEIRIFIALPPEWRYLPKGTRSVEDCSAEPEVRGRNATANMAKAIQAGADVPIKERMSLILEAIDLSKTL